MLEDITLLFCFVDDFCKECAKRSNDYLIETGQKMRKPTRVSGLEMSEIITIVLLFYRSNMLNFKAFTNILNCATKEIFRKCRLTNAFAQSNKKQFRRCYAFSNAS